MSGSASGFPCPECGSAGEKRPHSVVWIEYDQFTKYPTPTRLRLRCMACEAVWTESMQDGISAF